MRFLFGVVAVCLAGTCLAGCAGPTPTVDLTAHVEKEQGGWFLVATATNMDDEPIPVREGCRQAWRHDLWHSGAKVEVSPAPCHGFKEAQLEPGAEQELRIHWDGRHWKGGQRAKAPDGTYLWRVEFHDYQGRLLAAQEIRFDKRGS